MHNWELPPPVEKYAPLKQYIRRRGGIRLAFHSKLRDELTEYAIENWPQNAGDKTGEVLAARLKIFVRRKYSGVLATLLVSAFVNFLVKLIIEWWLDRDSHRILIAGWSKRAEET